MPAHIEAWVARVGEHTRGRKCLGSLGQVDHHHIGKDASLKGFCIDITRIRICHEHLAGTDLGAIAAEDVKPSIDWLDHLRCRSLEDPHPTPFQHCHQSDRSAPA